MNLYDIEQGARQDYERAECLPDEGCGLIVFLVGVACGLPGGIALAFAFGMRFPV